MPSVTLTQWVVVAETKEWIGPVAVTADGDPVTNFKISLTKGTDRPATWADPYELDSGLGVLVGEGTDWPLRVGQIYTLWIKFTDFPEALVERTGTIKVT